MADKNINVGGHKVTVYDETKAQLVIDSALTTEATSGDPTTRTLDASALGDWKIIRVIAINGPGSVLIDTVVTKNTMPTNPMDFYGFEGYPTDTANFNSQIGFKVYNNTSTWSYWSTAKNRGSNNAHVYIYKIA